MRGIERCLFKKFCNFFIEENIVFLVQKLIFILITNVYMIFFEIIFQYLKLKNMSKVMNIYFS